MSRLSTSWPRPTGEYRLVKRNGGAKLTLGIRSFAEYAIAPADTTFHLPKNISFEEGATIPLAAATAAVGLFVRLGLPEPWTGGRADGKIQDAARAQSTGPLLVYGAASAVGAFVSLGTVTYQPIEANA